MHKKIFKGLRLSLEQNDCLEKFGSMGYEETLSIEAGAGASKTTTMNAISCLVMPNRKGLYLAYNTVIVDEVRKLFPKYVDVSTTHGLAFRYIGRQYEDRLKTKLTISGFLAYYKPVDLQGALTPQAYATAVMQTVSSYCLSQDSEISTSHVRLTKRLQSELGQTEYIKERVVSGAIQLWKNMTDVNGKIPTTHDAYLKQFVLQIEQREIELPYEFVMLDEGQDTAPVVQHFIHLLSGCKKAIVGDRWQSIYEWRGASNAMEKLAFDHTAQLTTCYRFGESIADLANNTLNTMIGANVAFKGNPNKESRIITDPRDSFQEQGRMILTRTNTSLFTEMMNSLMAGNSPYLLKDTKQLHKMAVGVEALKAGVTPDCEELAVFSNWDELKEHADSAIGGDLNPLVKAVENHGTQNLIKAMDKVKNQSRNRATEILTTAHASKGAEATHVQLGSDFDQYLTNKGDAPSREEVHLLYMGLTRAKDTLDISLCSTLKKLLQQPSTSCEPEVTPLRNPSLEKLNALIMS